MRFTRFTFTMSGVGYSKRVGYKRTFELLPVHLSGSFPHLSSIYKIIYLNHYQLVESLFVEIPNEKSNTPRNVIIGIIYRPPNTDLESFNLYMDNLLCNIKKENETVYIMGDNNIDLFNYEKHILTSQFLETMYLYGFYPLINRPTRIKSNTATLIDNIFSNNFNPNDMEFIQWYIFY